MVGISLSIIDKSFNNSEFSELFNGSFNIGVDWTKKTGDWTKPVFFLSGTLPIDGIIKPEKETKEKKHISIDF